MSGLDGKGSGSEVGPKMSPSPTSNESTLFPLAIRQELVDIAEEFGVLERHERAAFQGNLNSLDQIISRLQTLLGKRGSLAYTFHLSNSPLSLKLPPFFSSLLGLFLHLTPSCR